MSLPFHCHVPIVLQGTGGRRAQAWFRARSADAARIPVIGQGTQPGRGKAFGHAFLRKCPVAVLSLVNVWAFVRVAIVLWLIVSFALQGYFVRGLPAASLKGG